MFLATEKCVKRHSLELSELTIAMLSTVSLAITDTDALTEFHRRHAQTAVVLDVVVDVTKTKDCGITFRTLNLRRIVRLNKS